MQYTREITIGRPVARAWSVLADVVRWPEWLPTVTSVELTGPHPAGPHPAGAELAGAELADGATATVAQPGRRPVTYRVTDLEPGTRFRWESRGPGVVQWGDHALTPAGSDRCVAALSFGMSGALGGLFGRLGAGKIRAFVDAEAEALARRVENGSSARP